MASIVAAGEIVSIARTKPGMLFLTLFISRAEILKQTATDAASALLLRWVDDMFPSIFASFQTRFVQLFPPSHIMPPIVFGSSGASALPQPIAVDDQYVWQFMSAVAMGANLNQQRILVAELRDKIFEVVSSGGPDGTRRVNMFLNAIGLDASQLQQ